MEKKFRTVLKNNEKGIEVRFWGNVKSQPVESCSHVSLKVKNDRARWEASSIVKVAPAEKAALIPVGGGDPEKILPRLFQWP